MRTLFFGESGRRLYGAYTEPEQTRRGAPAVLLCYPGVHEYNTAHWAFRRLATGLSQAGYASLRFDYPGTGDSDGLIGDTSFPEMVRAVGLAGRELLDLSGARKLWLVGLRLGGAAASVASADLPTRGLVLWDAVTAGADYIDELQERDRSRDLLLLHWREHKSKRDELLGYSFPPRVRESIESVNLELVTTGSCPSGKAPDHVLVLREGGTHRDAKLEAFWSERGAEVSSHELPFQGGSDRLISGNEVMLSSEAIAVIVETVGGERGK